MTRRTKITFSHYEGHVKIDKKWTRLHGNFKTLQAARSAGAQKCRPRYSRS